MPHKELSEFLKNIQELPEKSVNLSMSFEEITQQIRQSLNAQFNPEKEYYPWIAQTYFNHVIADFGDGKWYDISYLVVDGEITFADKANWTEVERKEVWVEKKSIEEFLKAGARHSSGDTKMVQTIHDHAVSLGAMCGDKEEGKAANEPEPGNALKAISETETELICANYLILWGDGSRRDLEGLGSRRKNADGSIGEYFTKSTNFDSTYTQTGMLYVDWEHGNDDLSQDDVLGYVDWKSAQVDEKGLWVKRILNRRNKYVEWLKTLIDAGLVGTSSQAVESRVQKSADGQIVRWPLKRDTLTVSPMEPRMLSENTIAALKALAIEVPSIKNACLKAGILEAAKVLEIKAKLAHTYSQLEV